MTGPFETTGDLPVQVPGAELPDHLLDVRAALELWERARDREREAMALLIAKVETARVDHEEPLAAIAGAMAGRTRQYVQKLLRAAQTDAEQREQLERRYAPEAAKRALGRSSGFKAGTPQCAGCKRFLKRADAVCPGCGYAGHGGYVGVPAETSHLERWR